MCDSLGGVIINEKTEIELLKEKLAKLENYHKETRQVVISDLFNSAFWYNWDYDKIYAKLEATNITPLIKPLSLVLIRLDDYFTMNRALWKYDTFMIMQTIFNTVEELLFKYPGAIIVKRSDTDFIVLLPIKNRVQVRHLSASIRRNVEKNLHAKLIIAVSGLKNESPTLITLFNQAYEVLNFIFIKGKSETLFYDDLCRNIVHPSAEYLKHQFFKLSGEFHSCLVSKNFEKILTSIDDYTAVKIEPDSNSIGEIRYLYSRYFDYLYEYSIMNHENVALKAKIDEYKDMLHLYGTQSELERWLTEIILICYENETNSSTLVKQVRRYVLKNYAASINLKTLSEALNINPDYLSRMFSKEAGIGFSQYLNHVRIHAAVDLMENSNLKLYEIAIKTGYKNVEHFSRVFKKIMGKSPKYYAMNSRRDFI